MKSALSRVALLLAALSIVSVTTAQPVKLGAGGYTLAPKRGDASVPKAQFRTDALKSTGLSL